MHKILTLLITATLFTACTHYTPRSQATLESLSQEDKLKLSLGVAESYTTGCSNDIYAHATTSTPLFHFLNDANRQAAETNTPIILFKTPNIYDREIFIVASENDTENLRELFQRQTPKEIFGSTDHTNITDSMLGTFIDALKDIPGNCPSD